MRNLAFLFVFFMGFAFGQTGIDKNQNFLRDYKAPDFRQKRLDIRFNSSGSSTDSFGGNSSAINSFANVAYRQYANTQKYQGNLTAGFVSSLDWDKSPFNEIIGVGLAANVFSENRFYFKPEWFFGLHGLAVVGYSYGKQAGSFSTEGFDVGLLPILSIGKGRVEPVHYARNAMDIERQLKIGRRLTKDYGIEELSKIADKIAEINNVRFYDFRFRRIEQFEELDKTMKEIGGVSEFDISYFAHLADAYLYANSFLRFSGFRQEFGLAPFVGFYKLSYDLPQSYKVQHHVNANAIAGSAFYDLDIFNPGKADLWVTSGYELGLYPTTRTNLNVGAQIGAALMSEDFGGRIYGNGAIWLSPQFRLNFNGELAVGNGNVTGDLNQFLQPNQIITSRFRVSGTIGLSYAIF